MMMSLLLALLLPAQANTPVMSAPTNAWWAPRTDSASEVWLSGDAVWDSHAKRTTWICNVHVTSHYYGGSTVTDMLTRTEIDDHVRMLSLGALAYDQTALYRLVGFVDPGRRIVFQLPQDVVTYPSGGVPYKVTAKVYLAGIDPSDWKPGLNACVDKPEGYVSSSLDFEWWPATTEEGYTYGWPLPLYETEEYADTDDLRYNVGAHETEDLWGGQHAHRLNYVWDADAFGVPMRSPQRYAYDIGLLDLTVKPRYRPFLDSCLKAESYDVDAVRKRNKCYLVWDRPIVAIGDGTITDTRDGDADNAVAGAIPSSAPIGNYVMMELDTGECVFYAHMRRGTVAVSVGTSVSEGDYLGRVGNSGNSSAPHLHIDVTEINPDWKATTPSGTKAPYGKTPSACTFNNTRLDGVPAMFHDIRAQLPSPSSGGVTWGSLGVYTGWLPTGTYVHPY